MLPRLVSRFPATAAEGGCMTPRNLMLSIEVDLRAPGVIDTPGASFMSTTNSLLTVEMHHSPRNRGLGSSF
jgi:hypothetical protein